MKSDSLVISMTDRELYKSSSEQIILIIPKSKSKNYQLVIELARKVESKQVQIDEKLFTLCLIDPSELRDCEIASEILRTAGDWKGFSHVYKGRTLGRPFVTAMILSCIMDAMRCQNPLANCLRHLRESEFIKRPTYSQLDYTGFTITAPCKQAAYNFYEPLIPISPEDQYQAFSVEKDVYWCPFFNMDNFKKNSHQAPKGNNNSNDDTVESAIQELVDVINDEHESGLLNFKDKE